MTELKELQEELDKEMLVEQELDKLEQSEIAVEEVDPDTPMPETPKLPVLEQEQVKLTLDPETPETSIGMSTPTGESTPITTNQHPETPEEAMEIEE